MAGYSGTPLAKKLGLKAAQRVAFVRAPASFARDLGALPSPLVVLSRPASALDLVVLFVRSSAELTKDFPRWSKGLATAGMIWVAWPKKASGVETDVTFDVVQRTGLAAGLVDVKVCAVDAVFSGLKFVRRVRDRKP